MPTLHMVIGLPGSGKTTFLDNCDYFGAMTAVSTDDFIQKRAEERGQTYDEAFKDHIKDATAYLDVTIREAIFHADDIVWDQTNLTRKSRAGKLAKIPSYYKKIAYYIFADPSVMTARLNSRVGKTIPANVLEGMMASLELPHVDEGFDVVYYIDTGAV